MLFLYVEGAQHVEYVHRDFWQCKSPVPSLLHRQSTPTCLSGFGLRGQICVFSSLWISIHQSIIYSGALCVAELFVSIRGCVPTLGLMHSTAGLQSNKRMSMGDLTSTNIPIIILLKHPISVCNPSGPQIQAPLLIKITHAQHTEREGKSRVTREDMDTAFYVVFPLLLVSVPQCNYFTILNLHMTDVCSYRVSAWSVLKHISVYLTKPAASLSPRQICSWNICLNFCHLHVSPWSHALPPGGASSPGDWSSVLLSGSPWHTLFFLSQYIITALSSFLLTGCLSGLPPPLHEACTLFIRLLVAWLCRRLLGKKEMIKMEMMEQVKCQCLIVY